MLVLARKQNQQIVIGDDIYIKVIRMEGDVVKLGIQAPISIPVHRQEVYDEIQKSNQAALTKGPRAIPQLREKQPPASTSFRRGLSASRDAAPSEGGPADPHSTNKP